jgi:glutathione S-transferase
MITLYVKTGCPYCAAVLAKMHELGLKFEEKNIADEGIVDELIELGGKRQVPFMDDDNMTPYLVDDDVEMYESNAIIEYLDGKYGTVEKPA